MKVADRNTLGGRLLELIERSSYSQNTLSKKLGVSRSLVSKWVKDQNRPQPEMIDKLAELFNVGSAYLAGYEGTPRVDPGRLIQALHAAQAAKGELEKVIEALEHARLYNVVNLRGASLAAEVPLVEAASKGEGGNIDKAQEVASRGEIYRVDGETHEGTYLGDCIRDGDSSDNGT